jgi:hypothetical protein
MHQQVQAAASPRLSSRRRRRAASVAGSSRRQPQPPRRRPARGSADRTPAGPAHAAPQPHPKPYCSHPSCRLRLLPAEGPLHAAVAAAGRDGREGARVRWLDRQQHQRRAMSLLCSQAAGAGAQRRA